MPVHERRACIRSPLAGLAIGLERIGDPLPPRAVRATMALRANVLAKGFSGISIETLEALTWLPDRVARDLFDHLHGGPAIGTTARSPSRGLPSLETS